ncbi:hypothetical protein BSZ39_08330 [Bowdeniella nasicola]|uniref:beta-N-acetylhexosaminidase n=1 Tax=Bowdeniella nasicola TaxID=208480 RepID=A0A1Q5Q1T0_9ACTO|nr:beta-N-acetylhexosaminidase [Bowdeniella nasicola]OKL53655.1 hypothetical protein BSZ39_08330 [Bowdeniella nasicola]
MTIPSLLPVPANLSVTGGDLALGTDVTIRAEDLPGGADPVGILTERLRTAAGLTIVADAPVTFAITRDDSLAEEAYRLTVDDAGVTITAATSRGALWGVQTLLQLFPAAIFGPGPMPYGELTLPKLQIDDEPAQAWRGAHLDVVRHFFSVDEVLNYALLASRHKLNTLHLHLTDDQGWRLPIAAYPKLTEIGAWRDGTIQGKHRHGENNEDVREHDGIRYGGAYTREDIARIVAECEKLGLRVIPEIDMPGHMQAAIAAYPELGVDGISHGVRTSWGVSNHVLNLSDAALDFCRTILSETAEMFPGVPIHIGGDECPMTEWETSETVTAQLAERGLTPATAQAWFFREMIAHVNSLGRTAIVWDDGLGVPPPATRELTGDVIVMCWLNQAYGVAAANAGYPVIMTPVSHTYLNHGISTDPNAPGEQLSFQPPNTMANVLTYSPYADGLSDDGEKRIIGGQFCHWTEYTRSYARVQYLSYPRGSVIAHILWSGDITDGEDFLAETLTPHLDRLTAGEVNFSRNWRS